MRLANLGVGEKPDEMSRCGNLPGMRPSRLNARVKGGGRAHQRLQRYRAGKVGKLSDAPRASHGQCANSRHGLGAVEQRQSLFRGQLHRLQSCAAQRFAAG